MLIPISDESTGGRTFPIVNYTLIALNIIVFIIELIQPGGLSPANQFVNGYSAIPFEITHGIDLISPRRVPGIGIVPEAPGPSPIYLTLLTSMFMHAGWLHIGGNMLYLWIFGDNVEDNFGHVKYLIFYLLCGFAAAFAQIAPDPNSIIPSLGASGAIAGVLGSYMIMFPRNRVRVLLPLIIIWTVVQLPAVLVIGFWIVLQIFSQFSAITSSSQAQGGVAYMAHIGGFFAGLLLTLFFRNRENQDPYYYAH
ncbi:MAG TPA: rhomboid family intramembrane serine protease [Blastocatellia bacterium]|nr:rhomboid family intramembrane serine protease [Blastocatellia bacterium]